MTLEETIKTLETMLLDEESLKRLSESGADWLSLNILAWLKQLQTFREKGDQK